MSTHREIERSAAVRDYCPALALAFASIATIRIRNQATIGGNLAHADPAQDPPPMLMALGAVIEITGPHGARTWPVDELFVDEALLVEDAALREQVWDRVVESEKKRDPEKKGVAFLLRVDRARQGRDVIQQRG
ncbi:MAG TPA: FAD binding domain-containing protein, partial [Candidatus Limnocylindria bacterium]|nr:FAD binding domain-containing protein [Candidatus Limnocylindria bacterium]